MRRTLAATAIAALTLALSACGGGSEDDETAAKAISDSIMNEQDGGGATDVFAMKRSEADCIGDGFVDEIGVEQLQEYGFITEDLKAEPMTSVKMETADAEAATGVLFDCADVTELMSEAMAAGQQVDKKTRECLEEVLTEDKLRTMFTLMFSGKQDQANQEVVRPLMECAAPAQ
jgi:uncharacterized protein with LGFP repeats